MSFTMKHNLDKVQILIKEISHLLMENQKKEASMQNPES